MFFLEEIKVEYEKLFLKNGIKKINRKISTAGGKIIYIFFLKFILQTKFRSKTSSVLMIFFFKQKVSRNNYNILTLRNKKLYTKKYKIDFNISTHAFT